MRRFHPASATPKYYAEFRDRVMSGDLPISMEIALEMDRIEDRIADPNVYYDPRPVDAFINFCEAELTKTDGTKLKLLDSFKLWAEQLLGWYYYTPQKIYNEETESFIEKMVLRRLIKKQYLIVARGGAKSMYAAFIQAYFLVISGVTTHQVTTAPTMKQAEEVISTIRVAMTRSPGPVLRFLTTPTKGARLFTGSFHTLLAATKKGIESFITGSILEVRPMSINKLQGLRPSISTVDEWLSGDIREDPIGALEQGASKLDDYIIVAISSEGTVRNASGDEIKLELQKILRGEYEDRHTSIFHYKLDQIEEVANPQMWVKAQPNIGITVSYEAYKKDVIRAENVPSVRNDILAKRFGLPMEGYTYFFTYEETLPHPIRSYANMECALGADLSQGDDFCSFTFLFPTRMDIYGIKSISFISERTFKLLKPSARAKYEEFVNENSLIVLPGSVLDMTEVFESLDYEIQRRGYTILCLGYDPYNSDTFIKLYMQAYGSFGVDPVRQGARTESVPLGELKKLSEDRLLRFDERIFMFAMGNTMVAEDTNGNRKLYKRRYDNKIDPVSALVCAYVAYSKYPEMFA